MAGWLRNVPSLREVLNTLAAAKRVGLAG